MGIAVVGGGTAGHMAASHFSTHLPGHDLFHIHDSRTPAIGVGEGTFPTFPKWIKTITGLGFSELKKQCDVTKKGGIQFEGWGKKHELFRHDFKGEYAYHISADQILEVLKNHISAQNMDRKVLAIRKDGKKGVIDFEGESLEFDFIIDARGFPRDLGDDHFSLSIIPTQSAILRSISNTFSLWGTRAIARPYGWIFVIPLNHRTSFGYICNLEISDSAEVEADFDRFFEELGCCFEGNSRILQFPSFARKSVFDGVVYFLGNSASFLEPLEATAIAVIEGEVMSACDAARIKSKGRLDETHILRFNTNFLGYIQRVAHFVGWHYCDGSRYDSPFWRHAKDKFFQCSHLSGQREVREHFDMFLNMAKDVREGRSKYFKEVNFAGFGLESFIQMGAGLGQI